MVDVDFYKNKTVEELGHTSAITADSKEGELLIDFYNAVEFGENVSKSDILYLLSLAFGLGELYAKKNKNESEV